MSVPLVKQARTDGLANIHAQIRVFRDRRHGKYTDSGTNRTWRPTFEDVCASHLDPLWDATVQLSMPFQSSALVVMPKYERARRFFHSEILSKVRGHKNWNRSFMKKWRGEFTLRSTRRLQTSPTIRVFLFVCDFVFIQTRTRITVQC